MTNSITFLGTGGDSIVVGKQMRASGGIVLNLEGNQFLLDPGPGCLVRARQADVSVRDTVAVLVSHSHTNHSNDVNAVLEAMSVSGLDRIGVVIANKATVSGGENEGAVLKKRSHAFVERVLELEPGTRIGVNSINIHTTKTEHFDSNGLGFIFENTNYKIGYTSDTSYSDEIADQYKSCRILIINCKLPSGVAEQGHLNSDNVVSLLNKTKPNLAIITHFGIKMLQADPLFQARDIQRRTGVEVIAATDGLSVNPFNFASKMRQVPLDKFS